MELFFDIPNLIVCLLAIFVVCKMGIIPNWIGLIFIFYSFLPFFLNDFLFPARYMKDQFFYFNTTQEVRSFNIFPDRDIKAVMTSWFLSLIPLPYVETVKSLGFFNRLLFFILFCWLYNKKFLRGLPLLFFIFYPSLVLYTSLSLRDPLVLSLMLISIIFLIEKKYFKFIITLTPLYFIKFQNFYFILILLIFSLLFKNKDFFNKYKYYFLIFLAILIYPFFYEILSSIDMYRGAMYRSDGGNMEFYKPLNGIKSFIIYSITALPYFIMKPFPWEAENFFQFIQSLENIFLLIFLIFFTKKAYTQDKLITSKWLLFSLFVMSIYGLVVYNFGTAVRYKFVIIVTYVIGLSYELYIIKGFIFGSHLKKYTKKKFKLN